MTPKTKRWKLRAYDDNKNLLAEEIVCGPNKALARLNLGSVRWGKIRRLFREAGAAGLITLSRLAD